MDKQIEKYYNNVILIITIEGIIINSFIKGGNSMKIAKKFATLVLSLCMVLGASSMALAAPNDDVISALKANHVPGDYVIQAENYLKNHTLTAAQADAVIAQIEKVDDIMVAGGTKNVKELSQSQQDAIVKAIQAAGDAIGLDITITSNGTVHVIATDSKGNVVVDFASTQVKQTGLDNTLLFAGIGLVIMSAGAFIFIRKRALA